MIQLQIKRSDFDKLMRKLDEPSRDQAIRTSLFESAQYLTGWIKMNRLSGPRPEFLGVVTGRLRSSITATPTEKKGNEYRARIGTNVIYGRSHEYGVPERNLRARPFMRPAIEDANNIQLVKEDLIRNINKLLEA